MTNIGKCLLFYLKYSHEMEHFYDYEGEAPQIEGAENPRELLKRIKTVGDAACRDASELLETCAAVIEQHFRATGAIQRVRGNPQTTWQVKFRIAAKVPGPWQFEIGIHIDCDRASLVPWMWCKGRRTIEDELIRVLGRGKKGSTMGLYPGNIALKEIRIPVPDRLEQLVSADPLVDELRSEVEVFTSDVIKKINATSRS